MLSNIEMIELVARSLGDLRDDVLFLGGATTSLLVTDTGAAAARFTVDVDIIVNVASQWPTTAFPKSCGLADFARILPMMRRYAGGLWVA